MERGREVNKIGVMLLMIGMFLMSCQHAKTNSTRLDQREIKKLLQKEDPIILELGSANGGDTRKFLDQFKDIKIYSGV